MNLFVLIAPKTRIIFLLLLPMACCQPGKKHSYRSDFNLIDPGNISETIENQRVSSGSMQISRKPVEAGGATWSISGGKLVIEFEERGYFSLTPEVIGLPASWKRMNALQITGKSDSSAKLILEVYGSSARIRDTIQLKEGRSKHAVDVREVPLIGGINCEPDRIRITSPLSSQVTIRRLILVKGPQQAVVVDRWGQRALGNWEGKIHADEQLLDHSCEETFLDSLLENARNGPLDRYGGFAERNISFEATGFFHTVRRQGRWWLVTPLGNPFYSLGVNGVRIKSFRNNAGVTRIEGRREIFEKLPAWQDCPLCFREDSTYFSFYCWNVIQYTSIDKWKEKTEKRLQSAGFNTIGNWSDTLYYLDPKMPYTYSLDSRRNPGLMMSGNLPDVFHPEWEKHLDQEFALISRFRNDPYLLGYFVDNEMNWRSLSQADSSSYTFQELKDLETEEQKRAIYAERYFSTVSKAIRNHDPNHLYMGCRFTRNFSDMEPIAKASGKYVDILSVNVYSPYPYRQQMDRWYHAAELPILISEHHIPPRTEKQLWPRYPNFPADERDRMAEKYIYTWAGYPYAVGSHWYQYKDQEVAGRGDGGENQPIGLVTVTDQPDYRLLETCHRISSILPARMGLIPASGNE